MTEEHPSTKLTLLTAACPTCRDDVPLHARIIGYGEPGPGNLSPAHVLVDLDSAREHAASCDVGILKAAVESLGVPW